MLELAGVSRHFGGVRAVDMLDLTAAEGEVVGLIGPNGSGKSTTINLVSGLIPLTSGRIRLGGEDISRMAVHKRLACGLARTFQTIRLFGQLTVSQNIGLAHKMVPTWRGATAGGRAEAGARRRDIAHALEFAALWDKREELVATLGGDEQRRLELARAVASRPRVLLLDEPAAGMNVDELDQLRQRIVYLRQSGITIVLVEHVMELLMAVADRIVVLHAGRKIAEGPGSQVWSNPDVRAAYLGAGTG
jgi:ABC-type branched-subunit amino acid transport system ATPase component